MGTMSPAWRRQMNERRPKKERRKRAPPVSEPESPRVDLGEPGEHRAERLPRVLQEPRLLAQQPPADLRREVDVPVLLDDPDHLRLAEDVESSSICLSVRDANDSKIPRSFRSSLPTVWLQARWYRRIWREETSASSRASRAVFAED